MLPRLRPDLEFLPSPMPDKPGLLIRDPFQFSDSTLIVPPHMVECLTFLDGKQSTLDLRAHLVRLTGDVDVSEVETHLLDTLSEAGFLEDENFAQKKQHVEAAFAAAPLRLAQHAGSGYPENPRELNDIVEAYLAGDPEPESIGKTLGIAAPHVSPFGGIESYRAAYRSLGPEDAQRTFVVLGTSHYGEPNRFGLTRKPFQTPLGNTMPAYNLIDQLASAGGDAVRMEDYCHAIEHSIEFQVIFLQHLFGPEVRILPVLCGSFLRSTYEGGLPEEDEAVRRMFGALGDMAAKEGSNLCWVLGVDMAHMGRRYGDPFAAEAEEGEMAEVAQRDRQRITCMESGDARAFWEHVQEDADNSRAELKWCGSSPIYTFLKSVPQARGQLKLYQQWNIDEASVVSFAGMRFV